MEREVTVREVTERVVPRRAMATAAMVVALAAVATSCAPPAPRVVVVEPPLPPLRVEQVAEPGVAPASEAGRGERVTLTAADTDLRALLALLAESAGVSLVLGPEVRGRVTVRFEDVPARDALDEVVRATRLMMVEPLRAPWGATVFYVVPVNVNEADAALIQARFGVSPELARFLVRARAPLN
jgi:type II secretory pathway component GspD/PulD (secretin)